KGAKVSYHDTFCPRIVDDGHTPLGAIGESIDLTDDALRSADLVMIVTDHSTIDYDRVRELAKVIIDTRNATRPRRPLLMPDAAQLELPEPGIAASA
ncbi:MAG TPA: UDP binding domain-containing protein, partial [Rhodothermales bacterium]